MSDDEVDWRARCLKLERQVAVLNLANDEYCNEVLVLRERVAELEVRRHNDGFWRAAHNANCHRRPLHTTGAARHDEEEEEEAARRTAAAANAGAHSRVRARHQCSRVPQPSTLSPRARPPAKPASRAPGAEASVCAPRLPQTPAPRRSSCVSESSDSAASESGSDASGSASASDDAHPRAIAPARSALALGALPVPAGESKARLRRGSRKKFVSREDSRPLAIATGRASRRESESGDAESGNAEGGDLARGTSQSAKRERNRQAVAHELLASEESFLQFLERIDEHFRQPLLELCKSEDVPIREENVRQLFGNHLDVVMNLSRTLLGKLRPRFNDFDNSTTKIGDIFLTLGPFFKAFQSYTNAFSGQLTALEVGNEDSRFAEWLGAKERMLNSKLRDLLIMPVQRLPRYVMLLHELNSKTKADHPDAKDLANAEAQMKNIADFVNERRREFEALERTQAFAARLIGYQLFQDTSATVLLLKEGKLAQMAPEKGEVVLALFTKVLVVSRRASLMQVARAKRDGTSAPLNFRGAVKLYRGQACGPVIGEPLQFRVDQSNSSLSPDLIFQATSERDRNEWVEAIEAAIEAL